MEQLLRDDVLQLLHIVLFFFFNIFLKYYIVLYSENYVLQLDTKSILVTYSKANWVFGKISNLGHVVLDIGPFAITIRFTHWMTRPGAD